MTRTLVKRASRKPLNRLLGCLILAVALVLFGRAGQSETQDRRSELVLGYDHAAKDWNEALPIGNGRLGAMVFGGVPEERIQFNEDTLWKGQPHCYDRPDAGKFLGELRQLLREGQVEDAERLARAHFLSDPIRQKAYQPFGDLRLHFIGLGNVTDYHRELDLDSAVARVTYHANDVTFQHEAFASYPDQVIVLRITGNQPGHVSLTLKMDSPHKISQTKAIAPDTLALTGQVEEGGVRFESRLRVLNTGGRVTTDDQGITVEKADAVTFLLTAATSFKSFQDISADPAQRCAAVLDALNRRSFDALRAAHFADYRRLFERVSFNLGSTARAALPLDQRLQKAEDLGLAGDPALATLCFQFGRYLLIASSRSGGQAANLQGIWNDLLTPPWESKWTTNINLEMNYWPAEVTNLTECNGPLFDLIDDLVVTGHHTARTYYGCSGWVLHHNTDLWRATAPINNIEGIWPTGGAWLCDHLWQHYLFTGDKEFLAHRAYPAMKGASEFFLDFLTKDPKTGWLVSTPSYSPEQGPLTIGPTLDHQLIRALMEHTVQAAGLLDIDHDFAAKLSEVCRQIAPNQIGRYDQLQEWLQDIDRPNNNHRHMSPLWALYPGSDITPADPLLFAAAKKLLTWRGDGSTGWSYAWRITLWARVYDSDEAFRQLSGLISHQMLPNLFDQCGKWFQIDGNFGATAGIAELLLQSQLVAPGRREWTPEIDLLPALPKDWPTGSVTGLCARTGIEVDMAWADGTLTRVVLRSKLGTPCRLKYFGRTLDLETEAGREYRFDGCLQPTP